MNFDLIIIGSGPGGYVAAIRASQLGMKVAVVEKEHLGGICLNWGCIPTKALLKSAQVYNYTKHAADFGVIIPESGIDFDKVIERSREVASGMSNGIKYLFKKNKITLIEGYGMLKRGKKVEVTDSEGKKEVYSAENIIIATGGRPKELPNLPFDGKNIISYKNALKPDSLPKSMVIVGAGAIGVEFAYFYNSMGTDVTIVEFEKQGLLPREDKDVSRELKRHFKKQGINILAFSVVETVSPKDGKNIVTIKSRKDDSIQTIECDVVLSAAGISPNTENVGLEVIGAKTDRGFVIVDDFYQTNVPGIYAIGDIIPTQALAHVASAEGITCVEKIAGLNPEPIDYGNIPGATYCQPEVSSVGMTEQQAKDAGHELKIGKFPYSASGKASAAGHKEGFVKLIFEAKYGELLGAHLVGGNVSELIGELVVARNLEVTGHALIKSIHPHPTMNEAIMEAAAAAYDEVIHI